MISPLFLTQIGFVVVCLALIAALLYIQVLFNREEKQFVEMLLLKKEPFRIPKRFYKRLQVLRVMLALVGSLMGYGIVQILTGIAFHLTTAG